MEIGSDYNLSLENIKRESSTIFKYLSNYNILYMDSGRSALMLLAKVLQNGQILLPEYICKSVISCFSSNNIRFYRLKADLKIDINDLNKKITKDTAIVFVMNYFGALQPANVHSFLDKKRNKFRFKIIEDTTHSLFSKPMTIGDYCVCSIRKWFPIPDGGLLYSKKSMGNLFGKNLCQNVDINRIYGMILKTFYLDGKLEKKALFTDIFKTSEEALDSKIEPLLMSNTSQYLLGFYGINTIIKQRKRNYEYLKKWLSTIGINPICSLSNTDCPFVLPIKIKKRDTFRNYLIDNNIYCAVHWPLIGTELYDIKSARSLSEQLISIPIDQRYGLENIDYIINVVSKFGRISDDESNIK